MTTLHSGIASIDEHHTRMFELLEGLLSSIASRNVALDDLLKAKEVGLQYLTEHFAEEESLMAKSAYPNAAEHRGKHLKFVSRMLSLFDDPADFSTSDVLSSAFNVAMALNSWLRHHVDQDDAQLMAHVQATCPELLD